MTLLDEFRAFVGNLVLVVEELPLWNSDEEIPAYVENKDETWTYESRRTGEYVTSVYPAFDDFNKEVMHPCEGLPDGRLAIRSDDDFWIEAILPYRFHSLPVEEIISLLWPDIKNPEFHSNVITDSTNVVLDD